MPSIERSISLEVEADEFSGYIDSARGCISGAHVTVYRIRRHGRTVVGRDRASYGYGDYYDYEVEAPNRPGRYYSIGQATAPPERRVVPGRAIRDCEGAAVVGRRAG